MSGTYTHKIILFSEFNFEGNALVIMNPENTDEGYWSLKYINPSDMGRYRQPVFVLESDKELEGFSHVRSLIGARGSWQWSSQLGNSAILQGERISFDEPGYERSDLLTLFPDSQGATTSFPLKKTNNATKFVIKFFPHRHAFSITPAPSFVHDDIGFRWVFNAGDTITFEWEKQADDVKLQFGSHVDYKSRPPVDKIFNKIRKNPPMFFCFLSQGETLTFKSASTHEQWFFNFIWKRGDEECIVDPEMQTGSGTNS